MAPKLFETRITVSILSRSTAPPFTREGAHAFYATKVFVVGCPPRSSQGCNAGGLGGYRVTKTRTEFSAARRGAAGRAFPPIGPNGSPGIFKPPLTWTPRPSQNQELTLVGPGLFRGRGMTPKQERQLKENARSYVLLIMAIFGQELDEETVETTAEKIALACRRVFR